MAQGSPRAAARSAPACSGSCCGAQSDRTRHLLLGSVNYQCLTTTQLVQNSSFQSTPQSKAGTLWCCLSFGIEGKNVIACLTDMFGMAS